MPEIKASPRKSGYGLFADVAQGLNDFASKPFGYDNPPGKMLMGLLGVPAVANTLNELAYGGALGTGSGMTWKPKADTVDAAMTLLPLGATAGKMAIDGGVALAKKAEPSIERYVSRSIANNSGVVPQWMSDITRSSRSYAIDPAEYGLPVNKDGTVSLLHGTTKDAAKKIIATGRLKSAGEPDVYLTTSPSAGYGDGTVVRVNVDPKRLFIDDEFPDGRFDFRLPTVNGQAAIGRPGLFGEIAPPISKTERIPVSDQFFQATGSKPAKMFADVERLRLKHPDDFKTTQDLRDHLINAYGGEPNFVSPASEPKYTLTTTPAGESPLPSGNPYRAAVTDLRGINGGNYQVISAFPMTEEQLLAKKLLGKK